jgi:hypothetical protein
MIMEPPLAYPKIPGGSVKRSLAMVLPGCEGALAKACGLDAATRRRKSVV